MEGRILMWTLQLPLSLYVYMLCITHSFWVCIGFEIWWDFSPWLPGITKVKRFCICNQGFQYTVFELIKSEIILAELVLIKKVLSERIQVFPDERNSEQERLKWDSSAGLKEASAMLWADCGDGHVAKSWGQSPAPESGCRLTERKWGLCPPTIRNQILPTACVKFGIGFFLSWVSRWDCIPDNTLISVLWTPEWRTQLRYICTPDLHKTVN